MQHQHGDNGLTRLSGLNDYRVSSEDPDPRGWSVVTTTGTRVGEVEDLVVDTTAMKVRFFEVRLDRAGGTDEIVVLPAEALDVSHGSREVLLTDESYLQAGHASAAAYDTANTGGRADLLEDRNLGDTQRLTRSEEELRIGTREVERGEVVVHKSVETEHVSQPVQRRVDHVRVERRPVTAQTGTAPTISEGEIRVPIIEEEVVVEKRAVVKEEIVLTRETGIETETVDAEIRKERVDVQDDTQLRDTVRPTTPGGHRGGH